MGTNDACWSQSFEPLGVPVLVIADRPEILATVRAAYPEWVRTGFPDETRIAIRLETARAPSTGVGCGIHVEGSRLVLNGDDFSGHADAATGKAFCIVPQRMVGDAAALRDQLVDPLLLFLLARSGRTPVHAAGILVGETALALLGPSGSGKSTLALAAARRGLKILSEDMLYVQVEPRLRVWGLARPVHVFPEDAIGDGHAIRERSGKRKAIVPLPPHLLHGDAVDKIVPVLLVRGDTPRLTKVEPPAVIEALPPLDAGFDLLPAQSAAAMKALLRQGAWRLTLGTDAGEAVDLLLETLPLNLAS